MTQKFISPDTEAFVAALRRMRDRHAEGLVAAAYGARDAPFSLQQDVTIPSILAPVASAAKVSSQALLDDQTASAQAAADAARRSGSGQDFLARMEEQKQKAIAASKANIDKAYASAEQLGTAHPEQQDDILAGMEAIDSTMSGILSGLTNVVSSLIGALDDILKGVMDIAKAFEPIAAIIAIL